MRGAPGTTTEPALRATAPVPGFLAALLGLVAMLVPVASARADSVVFSDSTGQVVNTQTTVGSSSYSADWFFPASGAVGVMIFEHGFSRGCGNIRGTAIEIMRKGVMVVCLNASMQGGNPTLGTDLGNALADRAVAPPGGAAMPELIVVGGHSAGGHFATEVGRQLVQRGYAGFRGAVLFDPVSASGFAANVQAISGGGLRPVLSVTANGSICNSSNNSQGDLQALPNAYVGVKLTSSSSHVDVEFGNSDSLSQISCGNIQSYNAVALQTLSSNWASDLLRGTRTAAYYEYGSYVTGLQSQGRAVPIKAFPACGNGGVDAGEGCDLGAAVNGAEATCCTADCALVAAGTGCRAAAGACDVAESCSGTSGACPSDGFASGTECRAPTGACDRAETCSGTGAACPADELSPAGTVCRASTDACDAAEACSGTGASCPSDVVAVAGTPCRPSTGACDAAEVCDGNSASCPGDVLAPAATTCRPAVSACDVAETCSGTSASCPIDGYAPTGTTCRAAAGSCDVAETCTGASATCPADSLVAAGTTCRAAAGACDLAEACSGASAACPADAKRTDVCRSAAGACDVAESCSGLANDCPADAFVAGGTVCRAVATACDVAESCTGAAAACPADTGLPDGDGDGTCDASDVCPADADPGQVDTDGDGRGDACDPCTARAGSGIGLPSIKFSGLGTPPGDDKATLAGNLVLPWLPTVDPVRDGLRIVVDDGAGHVLADFSIPGGAFDAVTRTGWVATSKAWTYKPAKVPAGAAGIAKATVKKLGAGLFGVTMTTKASSLGTAVPAGSRLDLAIVLESAGGACATATPPCDWDGLGRAVRCR